jgi:uncharacterized protein
MSKSWPELIDPIRLADQEQEICGSYPLAALERLVPLLHQVEGEVSFRLRFTRDVDGRRIVKGNVSSRLCLTCQRCLMPAWFPVEREVLLGVVGDLAAADRLPSELEPLLLVEGATSVRDMVEDELILALPVVAMHEPDQCSAQEVIEQYVLGEDGSDEGETINPFAILKSFRQN